MHWNHRVVDFTEENNGESWVEICEVFYDKNHQPYLYTARGVGVVGETTEEIKDTLYKMLVYLKHFQHHLQLHDQLL